MRYFGLLIAFLATFAYGQSFEMVRTADVLGYIVPQEVNYDIFPQDARYTPNTNDVICFEEKMRSGVSHINKRKQKKYIRQYIGIYNSNREKILICILTHKKDRKAINLANDINVGLDGEKYTIYYNTETGEIINVCRAVSP